jgi:hypothetical protein
VSNDPTSGSAFQPLTVCTDLAGRAAPQKIHLDIVVESVADATPCVFGLGATRLDGEDVLADPARHSFCLVKRPRRG